MALRGVKPTTVEKRLKALFYGQAGAGKTMAAISFPGCYLIDTEKGSVNEQYTELLEKNGGVVFHTSDFDELMQEVKSLMTEKHHYKTLVIDPITTVYNSLLDKCEAKFGNDFGRHYNAANKQMKRLLEWLLRLDMNVIITSHSKNEYGSNMAVLGQTYDAYKKLDYLFDLVFEIKKIGTDRVAFIKKTRVRNFPEGESFQFSYDEIAKRYGKEIIEKEAIEEKLASQEQIETLKRLIDLLKTSQETIDKWLEKANAISFEEMSEDHINKCILYLKKKIEGE